MTYDSAFSLNQIEFILEQESEKKFDIINNASFDNQELYDVKDFRWSFYCTIGTFTNWIGYIRPKHLISAFNELINTKNYLSAIFICRAIMESYASLFYLRKMLDEMNNADKENLQPFIATINKLIHGIRYPMKYPWGDNIESISINILTMIGKLNNEINTAEDDYSFLSNFCHPNFYPSTYILMNHPPNTGYPSESMKKWQAESSKRINNIQSYALQGLSSEMNSILDTCIDNLSNIKKGSE